MKTKATFAPDGFMKPFYIVLRDRNNNHVTTWHDSENEAIEEASRLASHEGDRFFVLRAVQYVEPIEAPVRVRPIFLRQDR